MSLKNIQMNNTVKDNMRSNYDVGATQRVQRYHFYANFIQGLGLFKPTCHFSHKK